MKRVRDAVVGEDLERHDRALPRGAADAAAVVAATGRQVGREGAVVGVVVTDAEAVVVDAVAEVRIRIRVRRVEVPPVHVVDEAVRVVVGAVPGNLAGIRPEIPRQIGMRERDAGIDDGDGDVRTSGREVPGRLGADAGIAVRTREHPLLEVVGNAVDAGIQRVVRCQAEPRDVVWLGDEDVGVLLEPADGVENVTANRKAHAFDAKLGNAVLTDEAVARAERVHLARRLRAEANEDVAGDKVFQNRGRATMEAGLGSGSERAGREREKREKDGQDQ